MWEHKMKELMEYTCRACTFSCVILQQSLLSMPLVTSQILFIVSAPSLKKRNMLIDWFLFFSLLDMMDFSHIGKFTDFWMFLEVFFCVICTLCEWKCLDELGYFCVAWLPFKCDRPYHIFMWCRNSPAALTPSLIRPKPDEITDRLLFLLNTQ